MKHLSNGSLDFNLQIKEADKYTQEVKAQFERINNSLSQVKGAVGLLVSDATMLSQAAVNGKLATRADAEKHGGEFKRIVEGVNDTLDGIVGPLNIVGSYMDKIAQGIIPEKITEQYYGDYDTLKNSINQCIDGLGGLVEASAILKQMALNNYTLSFNGTYQGIYDEVAQSINGVKARILHVIEIVINLSKGDMNDLEELEKVGKRSQADTLIPSFIDLIKALRQITEKAKQVANGDLTGSIR